MELNIYNKSGNLILTASPNTSSSLTEEIGGECSVSASFTHTSFILLDVDSYIEIEGVRYKVKSRYRPKQKDTQTYEYSVKFYAPIHDAEDVLMLFTEGDITSEFNYDGGPREHLQLWIDNMNRLAGTNVWSIGTVISAENKTIEYKNLKCWDAAFGSNGIAATFETEMWADGFVINLCKASRGEQIQLGYLSGLTNLAQEDNGEIKFFTRLFPLGSTRNIDASKYGYSRLQLPSRAKYVDKNVDLYGVKEEYEESAFSGIYPKYEGTVSSVRTENKTSEEGRDYTVYYFKDSGMNFNPDDYAIPEYTYKLEFQTGELAGRGTEGSFEAAWHNDTKEWEIVNVYPDDTTQIPGGAIIPKSGDKYIPWNFTLPQEYITAAEQAYKQAVDNYLDSYSFDPNKYTGTTDRNFVERNNTPLKIGWNVRLLSEQYFTGGYKDTRITKVVRKLNDLCQATITCTDQVGTTWKTSVNNQLNNLQYILTKQEQQAIIDIIKTTDSKAASDYNVFSALRSLATFLRKDKADATRFLLTLYAGAVFGKEGFASGLSGFGAKIDENGNGEMRGLTLWEWLQVPELRYNRVEVYLGIRWNTPGAGIILTCTPDTDDEGNTLSTGTCTLKLEDGEMGAVSNDDIAMGIYHFGNDLDATGDSDDSKGNFKFAGFATSYFRITGVSGNSNDTFTYSLRPGYTVHPQPQMHFSCYGNFTNASRQSSMYQTRSYIRMIVNQNTWEIGAANIRFQIGDLTNLNIHGLSASGYGMYGTNVFFTGEVTQLKPDGTPVMTANDRGAWKSGHYDYYDRVSHDGCIWLCVNEDGTDTEPSNDNPNWLLQVSKGDAGQDGTSFRILGSKDDESQLPQEGNQVGDAYLINGDMWVWTEEGSWKNVGNVQGPAGESVQNMGGWYSGLFVPYLGVVRMGKGSFMCVAKNGTYNPPYYTLLDNSGNRIKSNEGYILTGEINNAEYQLIAADGTDGQNGMDGVPGKDGVDGKTYYTWIRYADDAEGNGISNDPTGKSFIGFAYNKETPLESNTPSDYMWSDIKGEQGVPGAVGADGKTYYTWIAYSDYPDGNPMYQQPNENTKYIGIAVNKETSVEGTDPSEYTWSKFKGEDGKDGLNGADGVDGKDGTSIIWKGEFASAPSNPQNGWAYKNTSDKKSYVYQDGAWYQMTIDGVDGQNGKDGISIVWKGDLSTPPSNPQTNWAYRDTDNGRVYIYNGSSWELMVVDGTDGVDGAKGEDGFSVYITYNDSETEPSKPTGNGTTGGWHTEATSTAIWMSQKVAASSTEGTWGNPIKIKGETGSQGEKGDGFSLMGQWYDGMLVPYMGVVIMGGNSFAAKVATTNPPMWTLKDNNGNRIKSEKGYILTGEYNTEEYDIIAEKGQDGIDGLQGADGKDGIPGKDGVDGKTSYFHIKYSENENGYPMTETPSTYIGTYVDFEEKDSDDYTKYAWARFEGIQGEKGEQGIPGYNGVDGKTYYLHIKYSNDGGSTFTGNNGETPGDYIGVYTDTNPNDSNDTSDYTWSKTKGDKGDGYTQLGAWYTGLLVPKMGVVTMGGSSFVAKVATYNPPMWTLLDSAGNRIKTSTGYILTGGINTAEYTVLAEKGDKGDKGETGDKGDKGDKGDTGAQGKQGIDGCVIRDSEWTTGVEYRNDSNVTDGSLAVRYIDVVLVRNNATTTGWDAYRCKITHVSSSSITYTNTSYWEKFGTNVGAIFTSLIIAKNAKITFLQGNQLLIQEDDGTITAGASGSNYGDAIRFWAGSQNPDDAPFRVNKKGKLFASGAEIEGDVTANRIYTPFKEVSLPYTWYGSSSPSNMSVRGRIEKTNVISLDQPSKYNGVTIQIYCVLESRSDAPVYVASMTPLFKFGMTEYLYYKLPTDKITRITSVLHPGGTYRWVIQDPETDNFMLSI